MRRAFVWTYESLATTSPKRLLTKAPKTHRRPLKAALKQFREMKRFDEERGTSLVGVDEVGRGPLAGPLVAASVQLPYPIPFLPFLRDSKKLQEDERMFLAEKIKSVALSHGIGVVTAQEFGVALNLHQLTFLAMERALEEAQVQGTVTRVLVDGRFVVPSLEQAQEAVIKGDDKSLHIAAASVIAKVHRDGLMRQFDKAYPSYGFASHVGYGTAFHREAILKHGPCPIHRPNFLTRLLNPDCKESTSGKGARSQVKK